MDMFRPASRDQPIRDELEWGDRFVVMYAGAHGRANALHQLVGAAERLRDRKDILIACVGDGPLRSDLVEDVRERGLDNIRFHGSFPKSRMPEIVNAADVGAAVLQNNPTFRTVYPNKVFDYMACNRPVLLAIDGVIRELVCDNAKAGLFAEPENVDAIVEAILKLADDPSLRQQLGERGRPYISAHLSREAIAQEYLGVLEGLVARR
jgi:glycosyltransferase involved in cell wall biosynthesis